MNIVKIWLFTTCAIVGLSNYVYSSHRCKASILIKSDTIILYPGSKSINYKKIKPFKTEYDFNRVQKGVEKSYGTYTDSVQYKTLNGKRLLLRISTFPAKQLIDSAYYDANTLNALSNKESSSAEKWSLNFSKSNVTGIHTIKDSTVNINEEINSIFFDGYLNDFILKYVDLNQNATYKVPIYAYGIHGLTWIIYSVNGTRQFIKKNGERVDAAIVKVSLANMKFNNTFYINKENKETIEMAFYNPANEIYFLKKNKAYTF
ncbi:hypothetical protein [Mucilaginibacter sp.]|jgi:hypothetical protein|uniref:hypothetical protein n=1 Tax=Mucilaginibacter sp. TaxID=1882438 RepID=UPI0035655E3C